MKATLIAVLALCCGHALAQSSAKDSHMVVDSSSDVHTANDYRPIYFIGEDAEVRYMSPYNDEEVYLFEAIPIVRYSLYNNTFRRLANEDNRLWNAYIEFNPHLRMIRGESYPVVTPTYQGTLGGQYFFFVRETTLNPDYFDPYAKITRQKHEPAVRRHYVGASLESGHYSNGQNNSAFNPDYVDGSAASSALLRDIALDPNADLSALYNRRSGNFSTNRTKLVVAYRLFYEKENRIPDTRLDFDVSMEYWHHHLFGIGDIGGWSVPEEINIYGRYRLGTKTAYYKSISYSAPWSKRRVYPTIRAMHSIEYIHKPHNHVNPWRNELSLSYFPNVRWLAKNVGLKYQYAFGHDEYNYRFVDSGSSWTLGLCFAPLSTGKHPTLEDAKPFMR